MGYVSMIRRARSHLRHPQTPSTSAERDGVGFGSTREGRVEGATGHRICPAWLQTEGGLVTPWVPSPISKVCDLPFFFSLPFLLIFRCLSSDGLGFNCIVKLLVLFIHQVYGIHYTRTILHPLFKFLKQLGTSSLAIWCLHRVGCWRLDAPMNTRHKRHLKSSGTNLGP